MPFQALMRTEDLPRVGARAEDLNLDFKSTVAGAAKAELAKDVAAFANASGGTILIGATEHRPTNTLQGWVPLSLVDATHAKTDVGNAVLERCSPLPVIDTQVIERQAGQYVVAVNVWPYPLLPVNVKVTADKALEGSAWEAWVVFVRVGTDSKRFTPEQSAMLMIPSVRHTLTLLQSIPVDKRMGIFAFFRMPQMVQEQQIRRRARLDLVEVRPHQNVAIFKGSTPHRWSTETVPATPLHIPLNEIESVWSLANGDWCLKFKGQISAMDPSDAAFYYQPTS